MRMDDDAGSTEPPNADPAYELKLYAARRTLRRSLAAQALALISLAMLPATDPRPMLEPIARTIDGVGLSMIAMMMGLTLYAFGIKSRHAHAGAALLATSSLVLVSGGGFTGLLMTGGMVIITGIALIWGQYAIAAYVTELD